MRSRPCVSVSTRSAIAASTSARNATPLRAAMVSNVARKRGDLLRQVGRRVAQFDGLGVVFRRIEQVVDLAQQRVGQRKNRLRAARDRRFARLDRQQFGRRDDTGQRRAQLVADLGQQIGLAAAFLLGMLARLAQGRDQLARIHRHDDDRHEQRSPEHAVLLPVRIERQHQRKAGDRCDLAQVHQRSAGAEAKAERREQIEPGDQAAELAGQGDPDRQHERIEHGRGDQQAVQHLERSVADQRIRRQGVDAVTRGQAQEPQRNTVRAGQEQHQIGDDDRNRDADAHAQLGEQYCPQPEFGLVENAFDEVNVHVPRFAQTLRPPVHWAKYGILGQRSLIASRQRMQERGQHGRRRRPPSRLFRWPAAAGRYRRAVPVAASSTTATARSRPRAPARPSCCCGTRRNRRRGRARA